jgi:tetratricopeptide (TPR) repeat protein
MCSIEQAAMRGSLGSRRYERNAKRPRLRSPMFLSLILDLAQKCSRPFRSVMDLPMNSPSASLVHNDEEVREDPLETEIRDRRSRLAALSGGHPKRADACDDVGLSLYQRYQVTGSISLLDETIAMLREALALRPAGHSGRAMSCNNLANALYSRYEETGSTILLEEMIMLLREALYLLPDRGHPGHAQVCHSLGTALHTRYKITGMTDLLDEAITLHRKALAGHPDRAMVCNSLANAFYSRYEATGDTNLLEEMIMLLRAALSLLPDGHPGHASVRNSLGTALCTHYEVTGVTSLLDEAIELHREALFLTPAGHPNRVVPCNNLANALWKHYGRTDDLIVLDEAIALAREGAASPSSAKSRTVLPLLCKMHLVSDSPHFSISTATEYLSQASQLHTDNITAFMQGMQECLDLIWSVDSTWTSDTPILLSNVYSNLIDRLAWMTGLALDTKSQLTALKPARAFGADACVAALMSGHPNQAIELTDHAHGVMWAQALNQRDPHLQDLPKDLASELEALLRAVSVPMAAHTLERSDTATRYLSPEDVRHQQNSRIQTLLTEIRDTPGLERFMLGSTFAQLREVACKHPVVVLVAARGQAYALIISETTVASPHPLPLAITSQHLSSLRDYAGRAGLRNGRPSPKLEDGARLGLADLVEDLEDDGVAALSDIWLHVIKPVLDYLQLQVRMSHLLRYIAPLTYLL